MISNSPIKPAPGLGCAAAQLARALVEHCVHELEAVGRTVALRKLHAFVDDDLGRHVGAKFQLREAEQQDRSADGVELIDAA